jgi:hypothetical protein
MRKLISLVYTLALACAFTTPVLAGNVPIGGFCDSPECVQQSQPEGGGVWVQLGENLWMVGSMY